MKLRADHVAGAAFVLFGAVIVALSGDLPSGRLSMPGSGFFPKIVAALIILFGIVLMLRAAEGPLFSDIHWDDGKHALLVTLVTAAAIALYTVLGFIVTMILMMAALLIFIERRNPLRGGAYAVLVVCVAYACFTYFLKAPLPTPFWS